MLSSTRAFAAGSFLLSMLLAGDLAVAQITFQDVTSAAGITYVHHAGPFSGDRPATDFGFAVAASDFDRDGDLDFYVTDALDEPNHLYLNDGSGGFTEVAASAGVDDLGYGQLAAFMDLDNDGWDDLVVINNGLGTSRLYRNEGDGTFEDVTPSSGFFPSENIFGGLGAGDIDKDGDLDISVVGWHDGSTYLYRNLGSFNFQEIALQSGAKPQRPPSNRAYQWSVIHVDLDNDGWQEIFSAVDFSANYVMKNNRDVTFTEVTTSTNLGHTGNDMGIAVADIDNDLDLDFYITDITGTGSSNCAFPLLQGTCNAFDINDGTGVFTDVADALGLGDTEWGWGTVFIDADLDGDRDLAVVTGYEPLLGSSQDNRFFRNDAGAFVDISSASGFDFDDDGRALLHFDYDGDGDMDLITGDRLVGLRLLRNDTPRGTNHWFMVRPRGDGLSHNTNGVGARVYVTAGGTTQMQEMFVGGSFYAAPPLEAHFGLGTASTVSELRVNFYDGNVSFLYDVPADAVVEIQPVEEVTAVSLDRSGAATRLSWLPVTDATRYLVARGPLAAVGTGDFGPCVEDTLNQLFLDDLDNPQPGEGFAYLVQASVSGGALGSLGQDSEGAQRGNSNAAACR